MHTPPPMFLLARYNPLAIPYEKRGLLIILLISIKFAM
jgi:hypothetical protein